MADQILLTIPEVAARLTMTADGVYKLIQRGKLEPTRLSERKTRVSEDALQRFIRRQEERVQSYQALTGRTRSDFQPIAPIRGL